MCILQEKMSKQKLSTRAIATFQNWDVEGPTKTKISMIGYDLDLLNASVKMGKIGFKKFPFFIFCAALDFVEAVDVLRPCRCSSSRFYCVCFEVILGIIFPAIISESAYGSVGWGRTVYAMSFQNRFINSFSRHHRSLLKLEELTFSGRCRKLIAGYS